MFQRQSRSAYPARNLIVLAAIVLGFLIFLLKKVQENAIPDNSKQNMEGKMAEPRDSSSILPTE